MTEETREVTPEQPPAATPGPTTTTPMLFAFGVGELLHSAGVRLTGQRDSRGVAIVKLSGQPGIEPLDAVIAMFLAHNVQQVMAMKEIEQLERERQAAEAAANPAPAPDAPPPASPPPATHPMGTIGSGMVIGGGSLQ